MCQKYIESCTKYLIEVTIQRKLPETISFLITTKVCSEVPLEVWRFKGLSSLTKTFNKLYNSIQAQAMLALLTLVLVWQERFCSLYVNP